MGPGGTTASKPRFGLVLGAGGVVGAAWMTGALAALEDKLPCSVSAADIVIGTSAGSVLAAALRCGVHVDDLVEHQRGAPLRALPDASVSDIKIGRLPPPPRLRLGSPQLLLAVLTTPFRVHPMVGASACLPRGRAQHGPLRAMIEAIHAQGGYAATADGWVDQPTWIVAVDYDSGRRTVFGRPGSPQATLAEAVVASCAIPGWYEPVVINGRRYIDGGVRSATSMSLLADSGLDEVYVLAPIASVVSDHPKQLPQRLERHLRRMYTNALRRDVELLRERGTKVTVLTPGPADLAVMGVNLMDARRRAIVLETSLRTSAAALAEADRTREAA